MIALLTIALLSISCMGQKVNNTTVKDFSLPRYLGTWYEIARIDHSFEKGLTHTMAEYSLKDDGTVLVTNSGIRNDRLKMSHGKTKLTETPGLIRVSFFGPFYSDYRVMMVDSEYRYSLVGSKGGNYLWILSRTPNIPDDVLDLMITEAYRRGYNIDKLLWVDQDVPGMCYAE